MEYRSARREDRDGITGLHITGGQRAYAGILPAAYLADTMPAEKVALWRERLDNGLDSNSLAVTVAEASGALAGFCCFDFLRRPEFGTYLHNIYVSPLYQRRGVASGLIATTIETFPASRRLAPVHLLVFADNHPARAYYERLSGEVDDEPIERVLHDGALVRLCRYRWASADRLRAAAAGLGQGV